MSWLSKNWIELALLAVGLYLLIGIPTSIYSYVHYKEIYAHHKEICESKGGVYFHPRDSKSFCIKKDVLIPLDN